MKWTGQCPKCHSTDIIRIPGRRGPGAGEAGNNVVIGLTFSSAVLVTQYVCCNCGFVEQWIDDPKDIAKIEAHYLGQPNERS